MRNWDIAPTDAEEEMCLSSSEYGRLTDGVGVGRI